MKTQDRQTVSVSDERQLFCSVANHPHFKVSMMASDRSTGASSRHSGIYSCLESHGIFCRGALAVYLNTRCQRRRTLICCYKPINLRRFVLRDIVRAARLSRDRLLDKRTRQRFVPREAEEQN